MLPKLKQVSILSTSKAVYERWITVAYFSRFSMIGLEQTENQTYYLALKDEPIPTRYRPVKLDLNYYSLYPRRQVFIDGHNFSIKGDLINNFLEIYLKNKNKN